MMPFYSDAWLTVYGGDCREVLRTLPAESVHCVVTSPPYWGLRDYGTQGQLGLEQTPEEYVAAMVDVFREVRRVLRSDGTVWLNLGDSYAGARSEGGGTMAGFNDRYFGRETDGGKQAEVDTSKPARAAVAGLKPKDLVGIPWRVAFALQADGWYLRSDIVWSKPNPMPESVTDRPTKSHEYVFLFAKGQWKSRVVQAADLPRKGFHLSDDFRAQGPDVWATQFGVGLATAILDFTQSQEHIALASLDPQEWPQGAAYLYGSSIADVPVHHRAAVLAARFLSPNGSPKEFLGELQRLGIALADRHNFLVGGIEAALPLPPGIAGYGEGAVAIHYAGQVRQFDFVHGQIIASEPTTCRYYFDADAVREPHEAPREIGRWTRAQATPGDDRPRELREANPAGRNIRSVWTIATAPYPGAHFATFPPRLVEPCVKAGTSERGVCPECGAPWERVLSVSPIRERDDATRNSDKIAARRGMPAVPEKGWETERQTLAWRPSCRHMHAQEPVPAVVLDPFAGTGTVGMVAQSLSRRAVLVDLNPDYLRQCLERNRDMPLGLAVG